MKIVISGGEELGYLFASQYSSEDDVFVIENDAEIIGQLEKLDLKVVKGNPTSLTTLQQAEIDSADVFIACAHSDEVNVISCLAVKQISNAHTFCFVNKAHYFETFAGDLGEHLAIDRIIWQEKLLGEYISKIISVPGAIDVRIFEHENLKLLEYKLKEGDKNIGKSLQDIKLPRGVLAVAIFRENKVVIPGGSTVFATNDKIIFMGLAESIRKVENRFKPDRKTHANIVIVGGGNVGHVLAKSLSNFGSVKIRLLENSYKRCQFLAESLPEKVMILHTNGADPEVLKSQHVQNCDCFVTLTGSDERNFFVSMYAKNLGVKRIITRAHSIDNIDFFEAMGIDVALSSQLNAIQSVDHAITDKGVDIFTFFEKGKAEIREIVAPARFPATRLMDMHLPEGVVIAAIRRGGRTIVPHGSDKIKGKDRLRVFCTMDSGEALSIYLEDLMKTAKG
jgi:trk system potassium uptake protein TrkA